MARRVPGSAWRLARPRANRPLTVAAAPPSRGRDRRTRASPPLSFALRRAAMSTQPHAPARRRRCQPLSTATLGHLGPQVRVPGYDRTGLTPSIVHIGVGGFHRAHQAMYLDELAQRG